MPTVKRPAALAAVHLAAKRKIDELPTVMLQPQTVYRAFNPMSPYSSVPKPAAGGHVSKAAANRLLIPGDGVLDLNNRFSGPSYNTGIPPAGALYCVLQQQALINEITHYSGRAAAWALSGKALLSMRLMGAVLVAELSPHNPRAMRFLRELGPRTWDEMNDPDDCSVARGIALAIAETGFLRGIAVQTVRSPSAAMKNAATTSSSSPTPNKLFRASPSARFRFTAKPTPRMCSRSSSPEPTGQTAQPTCYP